MRSCLLHADSLPRAWQDHSPGTVLGGFSCTHRQQVRNVQSDTITFEFSIHGGPNQQFFHTHVPVQVSVSRTLRLNIVPMVGLLAPKSSLYLK